jgi:DNA-binding PadR family transcriptional regulator
MSAPARPRTPLSLVVLSLVCEEPMHPYRMQTLIKERGKDQVANVAQRNSVYQTIDALQRAGLIAVRETEREEHRPERTIYEATEEGRRTSLLWLRTILSTPAREFPDFPAALSLAAVLEPKELGELLGMRSVALEKRLAEVSVAMPGLPRIFLLESEYEAAVLRAEIKWLRAVAADLRSGKLTWSEEMLRALASQFPGAPSEAAMQAHAERRKKERSGGAGAGPARAKKRT